MMWKNCNINILTGLAPVAPLVRRGTRCLATVIGESGLEAPAGRIIVSGKQTLNY